MHSLRVLNVCAALLLATSMIYGVMGGSSSICTLDTCNGPVQRFYHGLDCEGEPWQYTQNNINIGVNVCSGLRLTTCSADTGIVVKNYARSNCQDLFQATIYQVGQCINNHLSNISFVYQCSVNDTFVTPGG